MKNAVLLFIIVITSFACKQSKDNSAKKLSTVFIKMERTPCFGKCPSYIITVFDDGKVTYEGKTFSERQGMYRTTLSTNQLKQLEEELINIDFFNLENKYDAQITDIPSCYITVNFKGKKKHIIDRVDAPKKLRAFEKMIDSMVITSRLEKINK